jgi:hypothetical protein
MLAKHGDQHQEQRLNAMQTPRETALAQHLWHIALAGQQTASMRVIAAEVQHGDAGGGHHLRITHLASRIFVMMNGFQHIVNQIKNGYNLGVHEFSLLAEVWSPST